MSAVKTAADEVIGGYPRQGNHRRTECDGYQREVS